MGKAVEVKITVLGSQDHGKTFNVIIIILLVFNLTQKSKAESSPVHGNQSDGFHQLPSKEHNELPLLALKKPPLT
jgi:hypothetical protein